MIADIEIHNNPNITSNGLLHFIEKISSLILGKLSFDGVFDPSDASKIGSIMTSKLYPTTMKIYNLTQNSESITNFYNNNFGNKSVTVMNTNLSFSQCEVLGNVTLPPSNTFSYYENCNFDNYFISDNLGLKGIKFTNHSYPPTSKLNDQIINNIIYHEGQNIQNLCFNFSYSDITSSSINNFINTCIKNGPNPNGYENMCVKVGKYVDLDEITPNILNYFSNNTRNLGWCEFGGMSGNAENFINALFSGTLGKNIYFDKVVQLGFTNSNISNLDKNIWEKIFTNYTYYNFRFNNLGNGIENLSYVLNNHMSNNTIFWLDLTKNNIDDMGASLLFPALTNYLEKNPPTSGMFFGFGGNNLSDIGVNYLVEFLRINNNKSSNWCQYDFSFSNFTESQWTKIFDSLNSGISSIKLIKCNISPIALNKLATLICKSPYIGNVDLSYSSINDNQLIEFSNGLHNLLKCIPYLILSHNNISDLGIESLSNSLESSMMGNGIINLNGNKITSIGANKLLNKLEKFENIGLNIGNNPIKFSDIIDNVSHFGGSYLGLENLNICNNDIINLSESLIENATHLINFNISNNNIFDSGLIAFGEALENLNTLSTTRDKLVKKYDYYDKIFYESRKTTIKNYINEHVLNTMDTTFLDIQDKDNNYCNIL